MVKVAEIRSEIILADKVSASWDSSESRLDVKGPKGELSRIFFHPRIDVKVDSGKVEIYTALPRKKVKALAGTWEAHIKNMVKGVEKGFTYNMKIVYAHFPIKTSVKGDIVIIDNFLGEKCPRKAVIRSGVKVKVKGEEVVVQGINKEQVAQTAANIEQATKIKRYDPRVFQDGIYIISKGVGDE